MDNISVFDENYTAVPPDEPGDSQDSSLLIGAVVVVVVVVIAIITAAFLLMRRKKKAVPAIKAEVVPGQNMPLEDMPPAVVEPVAP